MWNRITYQIKGPSALAKSISPTNQKTLPITSISYSEGPLKMGLPRDEGAHKTTANVYMPKKNHARLQRDRGYSL